MIRFGPTCKAIATLASITCPPDGTHRNCCRCIVSVRASSDTPQRDAFTPRFDGCCNWGYQPFNSADLERLHNQS